MSVHTEWLYRNLILFGLIPGLTIMAAVASAAQSKENGESQNRAVETTGATEVESESVLQKESPGPEFSAAQQAYVRDHVRPLLEARCFECHSGKSVKGSLRLTGRESILRGGDNGPAVVPGHPEKSLLMSAVRHESFEMPPRTKMPEEEIAIFEKWIADGAAWLDDAEATTSEDATDGAAQFPMAERRAAHWAWQPLTMPAVPAVTDSEWPVNDIDRFVLSRLEHEGLKPSPDAERRALIRRLYFDLVGLPPTVTEQDRFLNDAADTTTAVERLVNDLLASPHFGERWARHWLDLVRYAETLGHEFDYPLPYAFQYRDYVIRAFNADVPYDQFVREHIAGDLLAVPRLNPEHRFNESIIGTGFWFLGEDKHAPVDVKGEESARIDNQIDVMCKTFLGLTVSCARCHDHKFDAITSADFYALSGFLQSSRRRVDWIDRDQKTSRWGIQLADVRHSAEQRLTAALSAVDVSQVERLLQEAIASGSGDSPLRTLLKSDDAGHFDHPFSLAAAMLKSMDAESSAPSAPDIAASDWSRRVISAAAAIDSSLPLLGDLRQGLPSGWRTYGAAFAESSDGSGQRKSETFFDWTASGPNVRQTGSFSSGTLASGLKGVLQSPTFELQHPEILILASGTGCRLRLVIDGYVMNEYSELLFAGSRQPIETEGQFRWIRVAGDTHRYQGHRCHLELLDEGDGWFAVKEVRFAAQPGAAPPEIPCPSAANLRIAEQLADSADVNNNPIMRRIAENLTKDPLWPRLAIESGIAASTPSAELSALLENWRQIAADVPSAEPVLVMCDGTGEDEHLFIRGNHRTPGPVISRRFLEALAGPGAICSESTEASLSGRPCRSESGRLELAEQLLHADNPLPARVMVNRVWQHLFGRGLVATPDNLGVLGDRPTHPELLDFLAAGFRADSWSVKRLIRTLVLSRTYRMSSRKTDESELLDPRNQLLHRASVRRLEGEVIRDAMLAVSGSLDPQMFGKSIPVYLTAYMQGRGRPGTSGPVDGDRRRSVYQAVNRNFLAPFMLAFDMPAPASSVGRRNTSNVPDQALMLMNNELISLQSERWAERLLSEGHTSLDQLLASAYRTAFCRMPSESEVAAFQEFAGMLCAEDHVAGEEAFRYRPAIVAICHVLLNQKEFLFLD